MLPQEDWPELKPVPGVHYPEFLNASVELLDENLNRGRGDHVAIWHGSEKEDVEGQGGRGHGGHGTGEQG